MPHFCCSSFWDFFNQWVGWLISQCFVWEGIAAAQHAMRGWRSVYCTRHIQNNPEGLWLVRVIRMINSSGEQFWLFCFLPPLLVPLQEIFGLWATALWFGLIMEWPRLALAFSWVAWLACHAVKWADTMPAGVFQVQEEAWPVDFSPGWGWHASG